MDLSKFPTDELVQELIKRDGVKAITAEPYQDLSLDIHGPAVVIEVFD